MNLLVEQNIQEIDDAFVLAERQEDDEVKSLLACFICIRVSGLLETYMKERMRGYAEKSVPKPIAKYLSYKLGDLTNLRESKIRDFLGQFSTEWQEKFKAVMEDKQQLKTSLDSIITNRNNIAHGKNGSLTLRQMSQYYEDVKNVITELDKIIK